MTGRGGFGDPGSSQNAGSNNQRNIPPRTPLHPLFPRPSAQPLAQGIARGPSTPFPHTSSNHPLNAQQTGGPHHLLGAQYTGGLYQPPGAPYAVETHYTSGVQYAGGPHPVLGAQYTGGLYQPPGAPYAVETHHTSGAQYAGGLYQPPGAPYAVATHQFPGAQYTGGLQHNSAQGAMTYAVGHNLTPQSRRLLLPKEPQPQVSSKLHKLGAYYHKVTDQRDSQLQSVQRPEEQFSPTDPAALVHDVIDNLEAIRKTLKVFLDHPMVSQVPMGHVKDLERRCNILCRHLHPEERLPGSLDVGILSSAFKNAEKAWYQGYEPMLEAYHELSSRRDETAEGDLQILHGLIVITWPRNGLHMCHARRSVEKIYHYSHPHQLEKDRTLHTQLNTWITKAGGKHVYEERIIGPLARCNGDHKHPLGLAIERHELWKFGSWDYDRPHHAGSSQQQGYATSTHIQDTHRELEHPGSQGPSSEHGTHPEPEHRGGQGPSSQHDTHQESEHHGSRGLSSQHDTHQESEHHEGQGLSSQHGDVPRVDSPHTVTQEHHGGPVQYVQDAYASFISGPLAYILSVYRHALLSDRARLAQLGVDEPLHRLFERCRSLKDLFSVPQDRSRSKCSKGLKELDLAWIESYRKTLAELRRLDDASAENPDNRKSDLILLIDTLIPCMGAQIARGHYIYEVDDTCLEHERDRTLNRELNKLIREFGTPGNHYYMHYDEDVSKAATRFNADLKYIVTPPLKHAVDGKTHISCKPYVLAELDYDRPHHAGSSQQQGYATPTQIQDTHRESEHPGGQGPSSEHETHQESEHHGEKGGKRRSRSTPQDEPQVTRRSARLSARQPK